MKNFDPTQLNTRLVKNFVRKPKAVARISVIKNGHTSSGRQQYVLRTNINGNVERQTITDPVEAARLYHKNMATTIANGYEPVA